ncbi:hypothetical protein WH243_11480 [Acinetobacter sp. MYb177]|uniref:hypothetical protein n=1 Tax=unclassified Acinetobacter TaxID=196816 RepID=UPI0030B293CE
MKISKKPLFTELCKVIAENDIQSWKTCEFWNRVKLLGIENNNVNYQSIYRLLQCLVQENYLNSNYSNSDYSYTIYSETPHMNDFRIIFCNEVPSPIHKLQLKNQAFSENLDSVIEEVKEYENLKLLFPELKQEIDKLIQLKKIELIKFQARKKAIENLIIHINRNKNASQVD